MSDNEEYRNAELLTCVNVEIKEEPFDYESNFNSDSVERNQDTKNLNHGKDPYELPSDDSSGTVEAMKKEGSGMFKKIKLKIKVSGLSKKLNQSVHQNESSKKSNKKVDKLVLKTTPISTHKRKRKKKPNTVINCQHCEYSANSKNLMDLHVYKKHVDERPFKCPHCIYRAMEKSTLKKHLKIHSAKSFKCDECEKTFARESNLVEHKRSHTGEKPFKCDLCDFKTARKSKLTSHLQTHQTKVSKQLECEKCDYRAAYPALLAEHSKMHVDTASESDKPYKCHLCKFTASRKGTLNGHMRDHEEQELKANASEISDSEDEKVEYQCEMCSYSTKSRKTFNHHLRAHGRAFQCPHCINTYTKKDALQRHLRTHKERPFWCSQCTFSSTTKQDLEEHEGIHSSEIKVEKEEFKCDEPNCSFETSKRKLLKRHQRRVHLKSRIFECEFCGYKTPRHVRLVEHRRHHTGEKPYKCQYCEYATIRKTHLVNHERTHTGEKPFECDECDYKSSRKCYLRDHKRKHTNDRPFPCLQCDYRAYTRPNLIIHVRTHTGEKPFKCTYCDFAASQRSSLKTHMRGHTGEKRFSCEFCSYSTSVRGNLLSHLKTHTGERPHKCDYCDYSSSQKGALNLHMKIHIGEKDFKCEFCSYTTITRARLMAHYRTHTGEKQFQCSYCEFSASQKKSLMVHTEKHFEESNFNPNVGYSRVGGNSLSRDKFSKIELTPEDTLPGYSGDTLNPDGFNSAPYHRAALMHLQNKAYSSTLLKEDKHEMKDQPQPKLADSSVSIEYYKRPTEGEVNKKETSSEEDMRDGGGLVENKEKDPTPDSIGTLPTSVQNISANNINDSISYNNVDITSPNLIHTTDVYSSSTAPQTPISVPYVSPPTPNPITYNITPPIPSTIYDNSKAQISQHTYQSSEASNRPQNDPSAINLTRPHYKAEVHISETQNYKAEVHISEGQHYKTEDYISKAQPQVSNRYSSIEELRRSTKYVHSMVSMEEGPPVNLSSSYNREGLLHLSGEDKTPDQISSQYMSNTQDRTNFKSPDMQSAERNSINLSSPAVNITSPTVNSTSPAVNPSSPAMNLPSSPILLTSPAYRSDMIGMRERSPHLTSPLYRQTESPAMNLSSSGYNRNSIDMSQLRHDYNLGTFPYSPSPGTNIPSQSPRPTDYGMMDRVPFNVAFPGYRPDFSMIGDRQTAFGLSGSLYRPADLSLQDRHQAAIMNSTQAARSLNERLGSLNSGSYNDLSLNDRQGY